MTEPLTTPVGLAKLKKASQSTVPPPIVTVYGVAGVGKTTFAAQFPSALFLDSEKGLVGVKADSVPVDAYSDVLSTMKELVRDPQGYKTLVVDTLDAFEPLLWQEACRRNGWSSIEDAGFGKGYIAATDLWRSEIIAGAQAIRDRHGMTIVFLAHSHIRQFQSPSHESWDRYELRLHKQAAALITEFSDVVGFAHFDVAIKKENGGFNKVRARAIGDGSRVMLLEERPSAVAKNRFALPPEIEFSTTSFITAMREALAVLNSTSSSKENIDG
jgi:hypothetical protein